MDGKRSSGLEFKGFQYKTEKVVTTNDHSKKTYWKCIKYPECRGRAISTHVNNTDIINTTLDHNHSPVGINKLKVSSVVGQLTFCSFFI